MRTSGASAISSSLVFGPTTATALKLRDREIERAQRRRFVAAGVAGDVAHRHAELIELDGREIDGLADRVIVRPVDGAALQIEPGDDQRRPGRGRVDRHAARRRVHALVIGIAIERLGRAATGAIGVDVALVEIEHAPSSSPTPTPPPRRAACDARAPHQKRPATTSPPPAGAAIGTSASDGAARS